MKHRKTRLHDASQRILIFGDRIKSFRDPRFSRNRSPPSGFSLKNVYNFMPFQRREEVAFHDVVGLEWSAFLMSCCTKHGLKKYEVNQTQEGYNKKVRENN